MTATALFGEVPSWVQQQAKLQREIIGSSGPLIADAHRFQVMFRAPQLNAPPAPHRPAVRIAEPHRSPRQQFADTLAGELREDPRPTVARLAERHRPTLIELGLLRPDSVPATAIRRMSDFLNHNVYGIIIPWDELPKRVQDGRATGGRPRTQR